MKFLNISIPMILTLSLTPAFFAEKLWADNPADGINFKESKSKFTGGSVILTDNQEEQKSLFMISYAGKDHLYLIEKGKLTTHDGIAILGLGLNSTTEGGKFSFGLDVSGVRTWGYATNTAVGVYGGVTGEGALQLLLNPATHNRLMGGIGLESGFHVTTPSFSMLVAALAEGRLALVANEESYGEVIAGGRVRMGIQDFLFLRTELDRSVIRGIDNSNSREARMNLDIKVGETDTMDLMLGVNVSVSKVDLSTAGQFDDIVAFERFNVNGGPVITSGAQFLVAPMYSE